MTLCARARPSVGPGLFVLATSPGFVGRCARFPNAVPLAAFSRLCVGGAVKVKSKYDALREKYRDKYGGEHIRPSATNDKGAGLI